MNYETDIGFLEFQQLMSIVQLFYFAAYLSPLTLQEQWSTSTMALTSVEFLPGALVGFVSQHLL